MSRYDDLIKRLDNFDITDGIYADKLRVIADLIDAIKKAEHAFEPGDLGMAFGGRLEVTVGEVDHNDDVTTDGAELIGWITPYDTDWWFIPCSPQLHWSSEQTKWVDLDVVREENKRRHQDGIAS